MTDKVELLVVILNYKTAALVTDCLQTLVPQLSAGHLVVVVDNFSNDGSDEYIESWIRSNHASDRVNLICSSVNGGFSAGNNIGLRYREAEYYLLLNSDTLLRDNALDDLLQAAKNSNAGMISPRLEWPDTKPQISCFRFHNPMSELIAAAGFSLVTRLFSRWDVPIPISEANSLPEWTSFACVLLRKSMVDDLGLMDEGFFLYYEDVDYCRRARNGGWDIINAPSARVVHLRGGSSDVKDNISKKKRLPSYYYESRARYYTKYYGKAGFVLTNVLWHMGRVISWTAEVLGKKNSPVCEKQYRDIWINAANASGGRGQ